MIKRDGILKMLKDNVNKRHVFVDEYDSIANELEEFCKEESLDESKMTRCLWVASPVPYSMSSNYVKELKKVFRNQPNIIRHLDLEVGSATAKDDNNPPVITVICSK